MWESCQLLAEGELEYRLTFNEPRKSYVSRLPKAGETIQGSKFSMGCGGKGANQCVMSARLGASTAMVAKVGKDTFGETFLKQFREHCIITDHVTSTAESSTGAAPISVEDSGQNSIVIVPGANLLLSAGDLQDAEAVIRGSKVVVCQLEIQPSVTLAALKMARKHGVKTILNPAPAIQLDKEFYTHSDVFCPNETEAEILTGVPVKTVDEAKVAAGKLLEYGCGAVVITLGQMGCVVADSMQSVHVPAPKVQPIDTTGAGDCFIGALAFYLSTRPELGLLGSAEKAVQIASVSVQRPGTQTSYPTRHDLPEDLFC